MWTSSATRTFPRPIQNQFTLFKQKKNIFFFAFVAFLWSKLADRWSVVVVSFVDWAYNLFGECDIREYVSRIFSFPFRAAKQIVISFNVFWAKRARPMMTRFPSKGIAFASDELDKRKRKKVMKIPRKFSHRMIYKNEIANRNECRRIGMERGAVVGIGGTIFGKSHSTCVWLWRLRKRNEWRKWRREGTENCWTRKSRWTWVVEGRRYWDTQRIYYVCLVIPDNYLITEYLWSHTISVENTSHTHTHTHNRNETEMERDRQQLLTIARTID